MCLNAVQDNKAKRTGIIYGISKCHENEPVDDLLTNASAMYMVQGSCQCYTFLSNFKERLHVRGVHLLIERLSKNVNMLRNCLGMCIPTTFVQTLANKWNPGFRGNLR